MSDKGSRVARTVTTPSIIAVGILGLANSWGSLYSGARSALAGTTVLPTLTVGGAQVDLAAASIPLVVDLAIAVAMLRYVVGVQEGRAVGGWRLMAHAAVAATIALNAASASSLGTVGWHIIAPAVFSLLVELVAREALGDLKEIAPEGRIPARLWITAPMESTRVAWRMSRTGASVARLVRADTERCAAASDQLKLALPGVRNRRNRRRILRRLWSGVLPPSVLVGLIEAERGRGKVNGATLTRACLLTIASTEAGHNEATNGAGHPTLNEAAPNEATRATEAPQNEATNEASANEAPRQYAEAALFEADEADDVEAPRPVWLAMGEAGLREATEKIEAAEAGRRGGPSPDEIEAALEDGSLEAVTRGKVKNRFGLTSNSTADRAIKKYRANKDQSEPAA